MQTLNLNKKRTLNNLIDCIENLECNSAAVHEKNNILAVLNGFIQRDKDRITVDRSIRRSIQFIVKISKANENNTCN